MHQNQRDFVGPIVVEDSGRALFVTGNLDGAPAVDVLFMRKDEAEASLGYYLTYAQIGPLAGTPFFGDVMQTGVPYTRTVPVPKGTYYVIFDNSASGGTSRASRESARRSRGGGELRRADRRRGRRALKYGIVCRAEAWPL